MVYGSDPLFSLPLATQSSVWIQGYAKDLCLPSLWTREPAISTTGCPMITQTILRPQIRTQDSREHRNQKLKALILPIEGSQHNWWQTIESVFSCRWNCWNKFCIATLIFNNNTSPAEIAKTGIWKDVSSCFFPIIRRKRFVLRHSNLATFKNRSQL